MAEDQAPKSIPPRMTGQLPNLASGCDPDNLELVWENGQILIRGLSSKTTKKSFPSSGYFSQSSKDGFNVVLEPDKKRYDKPLEDVSIVPLNKFKSFNQSSVSKLEEEIPQHSDSEVPRSSLKQYEASIKFMRSKEKKSRVDEKIDCVNFSIFLRPPALLKSNHPSSGATRPTSSPGLAGAEDLEGNARSASRSVSPLGKEGNFMARNMKPILLDSEPQKESLPDEQSAAVGYKDSTSNTRFPKKIHDTSSGLVPAIKENSCNKKSVVQMVESSSVCSRGASNCPTYTSERRYEDIDLSKTAIEESESTKKAASARGSKDAKRKRKAQVHNLSERRRRDKINKKMRALQELIPNCNKVDKASMLDEAIEYLRTLQLQVQMLSMGTGVYMPPMMLPSALQHLNARARHLAGYSPMAVGMSLMRMQMGLGCSLAQFPTSLMSGAAALPGTTGARLNTLGFPSHCSQMLLMSMSRSPFVSLAGRFFPPSVQSPGISQAAAAQVKLSKDSNSTL